MMLVARSVRRMLMAFLFWAGNAATFSAVEDFSGIPKGTLASQGERGKGVITNVAIVLRELLIEGKHNHIRPYGEITMPTTAAELLEVMTGFYNLAGIPGCIGAVDGTLIEIPSIPSAQLEVRNGISECRRAWYSYKKKPCWLALAVCNAKGQIMWMKGAIPGATGDASAYHDSEYDRAMQQLHESGRAPTVRLADGSYLSVFTVGDSAFALTFRLQKCFTKLSANADMRRMQVTYDASIVPTRRCDFPVLVLRSADVCT